jgi:hypothetical protein
MVIYADVLMMRFDNLGINYIWYNEFAKLKTEN